MNFMIFNDLFENSFVISLSHRLDRRVKMEKKLTKHNLSYNFFDAVNGHELDYSGPLLKGEEGVRQSHIKLFEQCLANGSKSLLIFEDDIEFSDDFHNQLNLALESLPETTEMFYLGGSHHQKPVFFKNNVYKITHTYTAQALWISGSIFEKLKHAIESNVHFPVDVVYAMMQPQLNAFAVYPHLVWQAKDYSDIQNKFVDYDFLKKEFVRFEKN